MAPREFGAHPTVDARQCGPIVLTPARGLRLRKVQRPAPSSRRRGFVQTRSMDVLHGSRPQQRVALAGEGGGPGVRGRHTP
jgi:hypothetical protein